MIAFFRVVCLFALGMLIGACDTVSNTRDNQNGLCSPACSLAQQCVENTCYDVCTRDEECTERYCDTTQSACSGALKEPGGKGCGYIDTDNDGIGNLCDHCDKADSSASNDDPDGDGVYGACDVCDGDDAIVDADGDGLCAARCSANQITDGAYVLGVCLPDCSVTLPSWWTGDCFPSSAESVTSEQDTCIYANANSSIDGDDDTFPMVAMYVPWPTIQRRMRIMMVYV